VTRLGAVVARRLGWEDVVWMVEKCIRETHNGYWYACCWNRHLCV